MARKSRKAMETIIGEQPIQVFATAIYARLSVENSGKDDGGAALENQIEVCREYIQSCPYLNLTETYADNGRTGTVFDRPSFNRMMDDIRSGRINCLVVRDLSRFGRDYIETGTYIERIFPQLNVRLISVKERFDSFATDGSNESLMIPLSNLINDLYSKDISRKVSTALRIQMENGEFHWRKLPYGYRWNEDKTEIIPDERTAPFVREIFKWKLDGLTVTAIIEKLEAADAPKPETLQRVNGSMDGINTVCWAKSTIFQILKNPAYAGDFVVGRTHSAIYAGIKDLQIHDKSKWYITKDAHEPLVSREIYNTVQAQMEQTANELHMKMAASRQHRDELTDAFVGKIFCADCGKRMYFHRKKLDKDKRGRWYAYYECSTSVARRDVKCTAHYIKQDTLEQKVLNALKLNIQVALDYDVLIEKLRDSNADKRLREQMNAAFGSINIKLRGVNQKRTRLYEDFTDGILTEDEYLYAKRSFDETWESLNRQLDELAQRRGSYTEAMSADNKWIRLMKSVAYTETLTKELADAVVEKLLIHENGIIELFVKYHDIYELTGEFIDRLKKEDEIA